MKTIIAYLRLMRPPNLFTAIADILLGYAISGAAQHQAGVFQYHLDYLDKLPYLILATVGLYGGGVVLNDVFDYELDKVERPERPLPSGAASLTGASILGSLLLVVGVLLALKVSLTSMVIALIISVLVLSYDAWAKHHSILGPLNMGLCRGFNLLLGLSVIGIEVMQYYALAIIPVIYISAITMVSRGEVQGGNKKALQGAVFLYSFVILIILSLGLALEYQFWTTIPFLGLFAYLIFPPLIKAIQTLAARDVFKAVKSGVLALIVMDASIAAGFAGWEYGLLVLFLLPISMVVAKLFSVT